MCSALISPLLLAYTLLLASLLIGNNATYTILLLETTLIKTALSKLSSALILSVVYILAASLVCSKVIEDADSKQVYYFSTRIDYTRVLLLAFSSVITQLDT
jgi:hypothetical protein